MSEKNINMLHWYTVLACHEALLYVSYVEKHRNILLFVWTYGHWLRVSHLFHKYNYKISMLQFNINMPEKNINILEFNINMSEKNINILHLNNSMSRTMVTTHGNVIFK